jgi:hypothetical protein
VDEDRDPDVTVVGDVVGDSITLGTYHNGHARLVLRHYESRIRPLDFELDRAAVAKLAMALLDLLANNEDLR